MACIADIRGINRLLKEEFSMVTSDLCDLFPSEHSSLPTSFLHTINILMSADVIEGQIMGGFIHGCAVTWPQTDLKAKFESGFTVVGPSYARKQTSMFLLCHFVSLPSPTTPSFSYHHRSLAKIHPPVNKSCTLPVSPSCLNSETWSIHIGGRTYGRNGAGKCKDSHRSRHDSPIVPLDQGTCNHRSKQRGSGHGAIEKGECLGIGAAGAKGTRIGPFFFFDNGGKVSSHGRNDEDEGEA